MYTNRMVGIGSGESPKAQARVINRFSDLLAGSPPNIAIVRGEGIGDVIMTTPTIRTLYNRFPGSHITYITNMSYLDGGIPLILKGNPYIERVIDRSLFNGEDYDLVINLHCPCFTYEKRGNPPINRIDLFARHCGLTLESTKLDYFITQSEIDKGSDTLKSIYNEKLMLVQTGGSEPARSYKQIKLKQVLIKLWETAGIHSLILSHSSDFHTDTLWHNIPGSMILNNKTIREIAGVMVHCDLVLCPDSSILHLAGALEIPTVALFGPTNPYARVNHYPKAQAIWGAKDLACKDCWYSVCSNRSACWDRIEESEIVNTCSCLLKDTTRTDLTKLSLVQTT